MAMMSFLQEAKKFEIQVYKRPKKLSELRETHAPFSGSPLKHPYDKERVVLVADPYGGNMFYYEFRAEDITYVEELPSITNIDGETVTMARVWVKKKSVGIQCTPFVVEKIRTL